MVFVGPAADAVDIVFGEELRSSESDSADEDFRRLFRHQHCGSHAVGRASNGDYSVIFEQDHARWDSQALDKVHRFSTNDLGKPQAGIRVRGEHRRWSAADDVVGEELFRGKFARPW